MQREFDFDTVFEKMMADHGLDTVILMGHLNPDGDAAGSVMSLAHYIHANYPRYKVCPYLARTLDKGPRQLAETDLVFDPFTPPQTEGKGYLAIVCDTATRARMIGRDYFEAAEASIVLDHHASNEGYGDVNFTKISESCSENIYYILDPEKLKLAAGEAGPNAADYIYLGILHDTSGFARAKQTTMMAAAGLLGLGVDHARLMKTLQTETLEDIRKRSLLLASARRLMDGQVAYVVMGRQEILKKGIEYEDIHPISGYLRDCADIRLGFTMYEEASGRWRCSFRSDGQWVNVNELLGPFGGGGHAAAAGLTYETQDPEGLLDSVMERLAKLRQKGRQL